MQKILIKVKSMYGYSLNKWTGEFIPFKYFDDKNFRLYHEFPFLEKHGNFVYNNTTQFIVSDKENYWDYDFVIFSGESQIKPHLSTLGIPTSATISSLSDKVYDLLIGTKTIKAAFTYDLASSYKSVSMLDDVIWSCIMMDRVRSGTPVTKDFNCTYVDDFSDLVDYVNSREHTVLAMDLETESFSPYVTVNPIITIQFSTAPGHAQVLYCSYENPIAHKKTDGSIKVYNQKVYDQIEYLLTTDKVSLVGANLAFDFRWVFVRWGIIIKNQTQDTTLLGNLIDENRKQSLEVHAKLYTKFGGYDSDMNNLDKGKMSKLDKDVLLDYAGGDVIADIVVCKKQLDMLKNKNPQTTKLYNNIVIPGREAFSAMERVGLRLDTDILSENIDKYNVMRSECANKILALIPEPIKDTCSDSSLDISKGTVLFDYLFTNKSGAINLEKHATERTDTKKIPSITTSHITEMSKLTVKILGGKQKKHKLELLAEAYDDWSAINHALNTYFDGLVKHLKFNKDKYANIHPEYYTYSSTGRTRATCNAQTGISRGSIAKDYKRMYAPQEGYVYVALDYTAMEIYVAASFAKAYKLIDALNNDLDPHVLTSSTILVEPENVGDYDGFFNRDDYKHLRNGGKASNFLKLYGGGDKTFMALARSTYGQAWTLEETEVISSKWDELYPEFYIWQEECKYLARKNGYIISPLGRYRHLHHINSTDKGLRLSAERQSINSGVQGCAIDIMTFNQIRVTNEIPSMLISNNIHDALYIYAKKDSKLVDNINQLAKIMEDGDTLERVMGWQPQAKLKVEIEIGTDLSNMETCYEKGELNEELILNYMRG